MKYLAVEGLVGVGKTELAQRLAQRLPARLLHDAAEENPFLEHFYRDMRGYAFQTQLSFLFSRHKQQESLRQESLFEPYLVSDYLFERDRIFATCNLSELELTLYEKVYALVAKDTLKPDLVIYLQARLETVYERIRRRGKTSQVVIPYDYLEILSDAYNRFFMHYDKSPLLIVNADNPNLTHNGQDFETLYREIVTARPGRRYFSPAQTRK